MIGILIITHESLGEAFSALVRHFFPGRSFDHVRILNVENTDDHKSILDQVEALLPEVDRGRGVLIMTDIFGATPCNAALKVMADDGHTALVSGLNAPMLVKAFHRSAEAASLAELAQAVRQAGLDGIMLFDHAPD